RTESRAPISRSGRHLPAADVGRHFLPDSRSLLAAEVMVAFHRLAGSRHGRLLDIWFPAQPAARQSAGAAPAPTRLQSGAAIAGSGRAWRAAVSAAVIGRPVRSRSLVDRDARQVRARTPAIRLGPLECR